MTDSRMKIIVQTTNILELSFPKLNQIYDMVKKKNPDEIKTGHGALNFPFILLSKNNQNIVSLSNCNCCPHLGVTILNEE